jgi:hypothetical protein
MNLRPSLEEDYHLLQFGLGLQVNFSPVDMGTVPEALSINY